MTIVGFDVGKYSLVAVRIDHSVQTKETFTINNTKEEIATLLDTLKTKYKHLVVGSEATAEYHKTLALEAIKREIPFRLLHPITTKQFTRATVRKKKTDLTDALVIAKLIYQKEGRLLSQSDFSNSKILFRTAVKLTMHSQSLTLMKQHITDHYPEETKAIEILDNCIKVIHDSVKNFRKGSEVESAQDQEILSLLRSIPGIGETTSQIILAEIGDIDRFKNGSSLVAYAGIDPKIRQSGAILQKNTHLTKRGSPYLRRAIFIAASVGMRYDKDMREYYDRKRKEGRRYKEAIIALSRKMIYRIYAVWKRKSPYVKVQVA